MKRSGLNLLGTQLSLALAASLPATAVGSIEWMTVGNAGNARDSTGYGAVDHAYNIGKYEVTIGQYAEFLNAAAAVPAGPYQTNLWSASMASDLRIAGISRSGSGTAGDPYRYSTIGSPIRPITYVSWFDAARLCNWMHNGQGGGSTETGVYNLGGAESGIFTAQPGARVWIPTEDEWYKAAYYQATAQGGDADSYWLYPTAGNTLGNNTPGTGAANFKDGDYATTQSSSYSSSQNYLTDVGAYPDSDSYYGTFDQGGNVYEWNDAIIDSSRGLRGGGWSGSEPSLRSSRRYSNAPVVEGASIGFRLAAIPEASVSLLVLIGGGLALARRRHSTL